MLIVETPCTRAKERNYIFHVLLDEFLGIGWVHRPADRPNVRITLAERPSRELILPDVLFSTSSKHWLAPESMPSLPLSIWNTGELGLEIPLIHSTLPIIYGHVDSPSWRDRCAIHLPLDVFGASFFMLTRYEELVNATRDEHDRFPGSASLAAQARFLQRPIVDEYVEVLWAAINALWPRIERRERRFLMMVSHDVDFPCRYQIGTLRRFVCSLGGDLLKRGKVSAVIRAPWIRCAGGDTLDARDPYNTFDWLMKISEARGLKNAFYFMCGRTEPSRDADYEPEHPAIRALMRDIHQRGHEVGLHPSYNTFREPRAIAEEAERLRRICDEEGIRQSKWGSRMHYLRWEQPGTLRALERAGIAYDSTLGYADRPGFRCGTAFEYPAFDPVEQRVLDIRIRPLIAMERTVMAPRYMGLGNSESALTVFKEVKSACRAVNGCFTLLWHNSALESDATKRLYESVIEA